MNKIIIFNMVTLDGFFAGPNDEIDWHNTDEEFGEFANQQTGEFGTLIFGRVTYELMASYWLTEEALKTEPIVAKLMTATPKIVFSKTLHAATWENTQLFKEINVDEIKKLKVHAKKDLAIFGSGQIVQQFANLGLIDEYRLMINPIILGKGKPLFKEVDKQKLKLIKSRQFKNGNVLLYYLPLK